MGALGVWVIALWLGTAVFIPMLVIALIRLPSPRLALAVSFLFSIGAMVGFVTSLTLGTWLHLHIVWESVALYVFVGAGTIGGAALALALLRRYGGLNTRGR